MQKGLLTNDKQNKLNVFSGRIMEIEGLPDLKVEQAFELTDATDAEYAEIIEIDLNTITEPIVAAPNDPDNIKLLSEVAGAKIDEVFVGSCMTNIGHYRATAKVLDGEPAVTTQLWICPPTRMDESQLKAEGMYAIFDAAGARTEMPGCSLCMGNQSLHSR
jgi:aconitate hydratase 2 / 2-methylisocitrate dehydratase